MIHSKKSRFKPIFKQLLRLRENVQNQKKLFKFQEKKKWKELIKHSIRKLRRYKRYAPIDQTKYLITKFPNKGTSYKKRYRDTLNNTKKFKLLYGGFSKRCFKKQIMKINRGSNLSIHKNPNLLLVKAFESKLDTVLYRANFSFSIRAARQLIIHGKVFVNSKRVKSKNYILQPGDLISVDKNSALLINRNSWQRLKTKFLWPLPQSHLHVNYKTMEIIFGDICWSNLSTNFAFHLQLEKIMLNLRYQ